MVGPSGRIPVVQGRLKTPLIRRITLLTWGSFCEFERKGSAVDAAGKPDEACTQVGVHQRELTVPKRRAIGARTRGRAAAQPEAMRMTDAENIPKPTHDSAS